MKKNSIRLLFVFFILTVLISSCKNSFFQEKSSIKISLPFAKNSREAQQENIKYSFIVDCFEGSEITENPVFTQTSESGKDIIFEDVEPSVYSVRVRAFEYENFDSLLYEGVDTQPVIEGEVTTFVILLKAIQTKTDGPTEIGKIMFEHSNQVWLEFKDGTRDTLVAKTNCRNGVSVKNYYWFAGDLYLKDFSGPQKSELSAEELQAYQNQNEFVLNGQPSVIVEFSDGSYDVYTFSCYINQFVIEVANANFKLSEPDFSSENYMNFLNQVCMTAFPIKTYTQKNNNEDDSLNYTFVIPENAENYNSSVLNLYDFSDLEGKNVKYEVPGENFIYSDEEQIEKFAIQFKKEIPAGMYHANICVNVQIDNKESRNYILKELIYIEDGYITSAVLEEFIPFKKKTTRIADETGTTVETGETGGTTTETGETGGTTTETGETGGTTTETGETGGTTGETVIVEPIQEKKTGIITNCTIVFPEGEDVNSYKDISIAFNDKYNSVYNLMDSSGKLEIEDNKIILNEIEVIFDSESYLTFVIKLKDEQYVESIINGLTFSFVDGIINGQTVFINEESINHEYKIESFSITIEPYYDDYTSTFFIDYGNSGTEIIDSEYNVNFIDEVSSNETKKRTFMINNVVINKEKFIDKQVTLLASICDEVGVSTLIEYPISFNDNTLFVGNLNSIPILEHAYIVDWQFDDDIENKDEFSPTYSIGQRILLPKPNKNGYTFIGWHNGNNETVLTIDPGNDEDGENPEDFYFDTTLGYEHGSMRITAVPTFESN